MDRALADARSIVTAMRESPVDRSLADSLRRAAEDFERDTGIRTQVDVAAPLPDVGIAAAGELMRIVREALTNVRKHADATTVHLAARVAAGGLEVTVADNGRGFESAELRASTYGIQGMNERAELVGGSLQVSSRRADGTTVRATVPIPAKRANPEEPA
jgi:signal transduction histidine kinase